MAFANLDFCGLQSKLEVGELTDWTRSGQDLEVGELTAWMHHMTCKGHLMGPCFFTLLLQAAPSHT